MENIDSAKIEELKIKSKDSSMIDFEALLNYKRSVVSGDKRTQNADANIELKE